MIVKRVASKIVAVGLSAICCVALVGCGGTNSGFTGGVAATVNGVEIKEDTITKYIQDYRTTAELSSENAWGQWLVDSDMTADTLRNQVIEYYIGQEITKQAAEKNGVKIDPAEIDKEINNMKGYYSNNQAWEEALKSYGISEQEYRDAIEQGMIQQRLEEAVASSTPADSAEIVDLMNNYGSMFNNAKRSSHILFSTDNKAEAEQVLGDLKANKISFEDAVAKYSTDTASAVNKGDVGWDTLNSFVVEYTDALSTLKKGEMTDLVQSDYGYHIIKCTDEFSAPSKTTSTSQWPKEFVDYFSNIVESDNKSVSFDNWLKEFKAQQNIVINEKPAKLPYDVDTSKYSKSPNAINTVE